MDYPEQIIKQIRSFGALQYPIDKILAILRPDNPEQFKTDFNDPENILYITYQTGFEAGQFNLDAQSFEMDKLVAQEKKLELDKKKDYYSLRLTLFGI